MSAPPKKRTIVDSGDGGLGLGIAAFITNGEDLGPIIHLNLGNLELSCIILEAL